MKKQEDQLLYPDSLDEQEGSVDSDVIPTEQIPKVEESNPAIYEPELEQIMHDTTRKLQEKALETLKIK